MFKLFKRKQFVTSFKTCEATTSDFNHITFSDVYILTERTNKSRIGVCEEALVVKTETLGTMRTLAAYCTLFNIVYNRTEFANNVLNALNANSIFKSMGLSCTAVSIDKVHYI